MTLKSLVPVLALLLGFALTGCAAPEKTAPEPPAKANPAPPALTEGEQKALQYAMNRFVAALKASDTSAFATLFPQRGVWTFQSTLGEAEARSVHSLFDLRRDLAERSGLYESFFEGDGDSIRDFVETTRGHPWQRSGEQQFSPPDLPDIKDLMFIRWRQEDGLWVVDAVAAPFA
ncbi:hypothetical protein [Pelagibius sp. Alg239-R121]|uniref:hypothetical protein n=1 Tax=Pelagibius sp. Alg239-R121 TaxID=2993448 RepID=UPI0024A61C38|nr:hypothetical protein [Pelagibius sp. Alg239-R121]